MIPVEYIGEGLPDEVIKIITWGEIIENPDTIPGSWARSSVNGSDKWTEGCHTCISGVVLGQTPFYEQVSLLVHLNLGAVNEKKDLFRVKYPNLLLELGKQTDKQSAFIIGGYKNPHSLKDTVSFDYYNTVPTLEGYHRDILGIETLVLPPKNFDGITNVFVKTDEHRIYVQELNRKSPFVIALLASRLEFPSQGLLRSSSIF